MTSELIRLFDGLPSIFDSNFPRRFFEDRGSWDVFYTKDVFPYDVVIETDNEGNGLKTELVYAVAGIDKDSINVKVKNDSLSITITDEPRAVEPDDNSNTRTYIHKGISHRKMQKTFTLSNNIDRENITSKLENGLLTITIPHFKPVDNTKIVDIKVR